MQYKTKIYISEVTNLSDARYAAGMLVDYIGFPIDDSMERHIDLNTFNAITGWLEGINIVAEFSTTSTQEINKIIENQEVKIVSLPSVRMEDCSQINAKVILREVAEDLENLPENILFTTTKTTQKNNYFLEDVSIENIDANLQKQNMEGIILKGSEEERPGYQDYDEMADIIDHLEI